MSAPQGTSPEAVSFWLTSEARKKFKKKKLINVPDGMAERVRVLTEQYITENPGEVDHEVAQEWVLEEYKDLHCGNIFESFGVWIMSGVITWMVGKLLDWYFRESAE